MSITKKTFSGVSLFEVLTAIIIFTTGILVLLSMIGSNISWVRTIRLKDNATMLGKEAMEILYNMRDSNLEKGLDRYCGEFDDSQPDNCGFPMYQGLTGTTYILDRDTSVATGDYNMYTLTQLASFDDARLYYHTGVIGLSGGLNLTGFWYNHDSVGGTETPYSRYVVIKPVDDYSSNTGEILQIEVHVVANQGARDYEIIIESLLGDIR